MMNAEQKRWVARLKRCLKEMPEGIEVIVESGSRDVSVVRILPDGAFIEDDESRDSDRLHSNYVDKEFDSFFVNRVIPNSENI